MHAERQPGGRHQPHTDRRRSSLSLNGPKSWNRVNWPACRTLPTRTVRALPGGPHEVSSLVHCRRGRSAWTSPMAVGVAA